MIGMNSQLQSNSLLTLNLTLENFELRNGNQELYKSPRENKSTQLNLFTGSVGYRLAEKARFELALQLIAVLTP